MPFSMRGACGTISEITLEDNTDGAITNIACPACSVPYIMRSPIAMTEEVRKAHV